MVTMETRTVKICEDGTNMNILEYDKKANTSFLFKYVGKGKYTPIISQTWTMRSLIN